MFCHRLIVCCSMLLSCKWTLPLHADDLQAALKDRIGKMEKEVRRIEQEKTQSEQLLANGESLLERAKKEKDQEAAVVVKRAIAKAQQAIATFENNLASAKARIETLTGALNSVAALPPPKEPIIPASVVDLRDVKDFTLDPAKVGGYTKQLDTRLNSEKTRSLRAEVRTRAAGNRGGNLATMSYAELIAGIDDEARQGIEQGEQARQTEAEAKLRAAMQLPANAEEQLLDLVLSPAPQQPQAKKTGVFDKALGVLRRFDLVRNEEKERMWEAYRNWKAETELAVQRVREGQSSEKEFEDESKLADSKFLFLGTVIGKVASLSEDEEIDGQFPEASKNSSGGTK